MEAFVNIEKHAKIQPLHTLKNPEKLENQYYFKVNK